MHPIAGRKAIQVQKNTVKIKRLKPYRIQPSTWRMLSYNSQVKKNSRSLRQQKTRYLNTGEEGLQQWGNKTSGFELINHWKMQERLMQYMTGTSNAKFG
jgi:hypothetical protein